MDVEKILATIAILAGAFKATTSALKDLHDIAKDKKQSPDKEDR